MTPDPLWKCLFGDDSQAVENVLVTTRVLGYEMFSDNVYELIGPDGRCRPTEVIAKVHPNYGPVRGSLLMSRPAGSRQPWQDLAFFPLLAGGMPNRTWIQRVIPRDNGVEGEIIALLSGKMYGCFTEPMYWGNWSEYQEGTDCVCTLSGLAMQLQRMPVRRFNQVKTILRQPVPNQIGDADGFIKLDSAEPAPQVTGIRLDGSALCRSLIAAVDRYEALGVPLHRLLVTLNTGDIAEPTWYYLYVADLMLRGYRPVIGDEIEAEVAMQGHLTSLPPIDEPPLADASLYEEDAVEAFACAMNTGLVSPLASMFTENVLYESPSVGVFRAGRQEVIDYLQQTLADWTRKDIRGFIEMGQLITDGEPRPCALVAFDNPNDATGIVLFEISNDLIARIHVRWRTVKSVAQATRRLGRYPK